jgi:3-phosphoshikimate 1-carboxyvinyltransferase
MWSVAASATHNTQDSTMTQPVEITAPPSKSLSHRAIMAAAMALGDSRLTGVLESEDTERTMDILRKTGARIERTGPGAYTVGGVLGVPSGGATEPMDLDVGESGTTCRLITPILACGNGEFLLRGHGRMHDRPIGELTDVLRSLSVDIEFVDRDGYPPFILRAAGIPGGTVAISMDESSQYLSGLLLAGPIARKPLTVELTGKRAVSWPYVGLTLQTMEDFGAAFRVDQKDENGEWEETDWRSLTRAEPGRLRFRTKLSMYMARGLRVEGDWSNASYFLAAGAVGQAPVRIEGLRADSLQGDRAMLAILYDMGARIEVSGDGVTVFPSQLRGVNADLSACPDLAPTVAAVAACAKGDTIIRGAAHLRIKECDRIAAPAAELAKVGATVEERADGMRIVPPERLASGASFATHNDHRIAMSLAVLQAAGVDATFDVPEVVNKSFPSFWDQWAKVAGA